MSPQIILYKYECLLRVLLVHLLEQHFEVFSIHLIFGSSFKEKSYCLYPMNRYACGTCQIDHSFCLRLVNKWSKEFTLLKMTGWPINEYPYFYSALLNPTSSITNTRWFGSVREVKNSLMKSTRWLILALDPRGLYWVILL